jgi:hypothetical protein
MGASELGFLAKSGSEDEGASVVDVVVQAVEFV